MEIAQYNCIINNLTERIENCKKHLDGILSTDDLSNLSIKDFLELKSFCKQENIDMTEICMVDLYHILGMGNLSVVQTQKFLKLLNKYTSYRSDIKCICSISDVESLPKLPTCSKYTLHKLGNITLRSKGRGTKEAVEIDETCCVDDYHKAKLNDLASKIQLDSIILEGNILTVDTSEIDKVIPFICKTAKKENLIKACENKLNYCDAIWEYTDDTKTKLKAVFVTSSKRDSVRDKLKARGIMI